RAQLSLEHVEPLRAEHDRTLIVVEDLLERLLRAEADLELERFDVAGAARLASEPIFRRRVRHWRIIRAAPACRQPRGQREGEPRRRPMSHCLSWATGRPGRA